MKEIPLVLLTLLLSRQLLAQHSGEIKEEAWKGIYRSSAQKINDLVNTKLDVSFDYDKCYMQGKAWITLKPHFYPTDTLSLDAKGMDIHKLAILKGTSLVPLKYDYDGMILKIHIPDLNTKKCL
jgi:aminopeptidase N